MSVQKYKRSAGCKSESVHSTYSFSQDVNLLQDYEYLLQKSAEELTKVKEQNQFLEQQLEAQQLTQPINNNQYSTFQFNKNDVLIEQLKIENADLKLKLETKSKANKKLKNKCKLFEQITKENISLKQDLQDFLKEKINNKENRSISGNQALRPTSLQQQFSLSQKLDTSLSVSYNCKAIEEADKFLIETRLHSSRIQKFQPPITPKKIEIQQVVLNFSETDIKNNLDMQDDFVKFIELTTVRAGEKLNQRIQTQKLEEIVKANAELESYVLELSEQLWILQSKNKIQTDLIKELMNLTEKHNFKEMLEALQKISNQDIQLINELESLDNISQQIATNGEQLYQVNQNILKNMEINNTKSQQIKENSQNVYNQEDKENNPNSCNQMKPCSAKVQKTQTDQYPKPQAILDIKEYTLLRSDYQKLFSDISALQSELQYYETIAEQSISRQELFEILEKFTEQISYRESTPIKDQLIYQIDQVIREKNELKQRYLELLYKVILNQIKTDPRRTELLVKNDIKLQEAMKWLLQSTSRQTLQETIFQYCDVLTEFICKKQNHSSKMSELHEIISMQMKVIYTLLQSLQNEKYKLNSSRTTVSKTDKQENLMSQAIQDLKELNKKIANLPENHDDQDSCNLTSNILQLCNRIVK